MGIRHTIGMKADLVKPRTIPCVAVFPTIKIKKSCNSCWLTGYLLVAFTLDCFGRGSETSWEDCLQPIFGYIINEIINHFKSSTTEN